MFKELKNIREKNKELIIVFSLLERIATKIVKICVDYKTENTITFVDYNDMAEYYVDIDKANRLIDYCYNEYFFKIILSGSEFYQKSKKICLEDLKIDPYLFDHFFRVLFFIIKDRYECKTVNPPDFTKNIVYRLMEKSSLETFDNIPIIDRNLFSKKWVIMLKKHEDTGLINYYTNDLTNDRKLRSYFAISCDTFKFYKNDDLDLNYRTFSNVFEFLDLRLYINSNSCLNHNLLQKLDKIVHMLILISFDDKDVKYYDNEFSDNSYIKTTQKILKNKIT